MNFKIDTKTNYTIITPSFSDLNSEMAASLAKYCQEQSAQKPINFIVDLLPCTDAHTDAFPALIDLHEACYSNDQSLVFINVKDNIMQKMKKEQVHLTLNIAPTLAEGIDIISMEVLERDLFNEE